ncbi:MAG: protein TolR [Saezia sp.]
MSEMNVVPYIDVMLVLLIIFMVTAPMLATGAIEIPSAGAASRTPEQFIRVSINISQEITLSNTSGATTPITLEQLVAEVKAMQGDSREIPVIIAADKQLPYEKVVQILNTLQENNVHRVGLLTTK